MNVFEKYGNLETDEPVKKQNVFEKYGSEKQNVFEKYSEPESKLKRAAKWAGKATLAGVSELPMVKPIVKIAKQLDDPRYTAEKHRQSGKKYDEQEYDEQGYPIEKVSPLMVKSTSSGEILNWSTQQKEIEDRLKRGEGFVPAAVPEDTKKINKRIPGDYQESTSGHKITEGIESDILNDPVVNAVTFGTMKGIQGVKASLSAGKVIGSVVKEGVSAATGGVTEIPGLTKSILKASKTKAGQQVLKESRGFVDELLKRGSPHKEEIKKSVFEGIKKSKLARPFKTKLYEEWDSLETLFKKTKGYNPMTEISPIDAKVLFYNGIENEVKNVVDWTVDTDKSIAKLSKELKIDKKLLNKDIDDYAYAMHAPDYNKMHPEIDGKITDKASGITDAEADEILKRIEESPHAEKIKEQAKKIQDYSKGTLELLNKNGLVDDEYTKLLQESYPNHVGLQRIMDDDVLHEAILGNRLDVKTSGILKGVGSDRPVKEILENVVSARMQAVKRIEKNVLDNHLFESAQDFNKQMESDLFSWEELPKGAYADEKNVLQFYKDGKHMALTMNDPEIARAVKLIGTKHLSPVLKAIGAYSRFRGKMAVKNLTFPIRNKLTDIMEAVPWLMLNREPKKVKVLKSIADTTGYKAVVDFKLGKDTADSRWFKDLLEQRGIGGGYSSVLKKNPEDTLKNIRNLNRSKPRQAVKAVSDFLGSYSEFFENSTKINSYKALVESGIPKKKAAYMAYAASTPFNKRGEWTPAMNALYLFSGASIQGTGKWGAIEGAGRVAGTGATLAKTVLKKSLPVGIGIFAINKWNDSQDPDWRKKVNKQDRKSGAQFFLPNTDGEYFQVRMPYSDRPFVTFFQNASDLMSGSDVDARDAITDIVSSTWESYSPVTGGSGIQTLTPTAGSLITDRALNRRYNSFPIYPDYMHGDDEKYPRSIKYFPRERETLVGKGLIEGTKWLAEKTKDKEGKRKGIEISPSVLHYALQQTLGGWGQFTEQAVETGKSIAKGETPHPSKVPLASSYFRKPDPDMYNDKEEDKLINYEMGEFNRERFYENETLQKLAKGSNGKIWKYLQEIEPSQIDRVAKKIEEIELTKWGPQWYKKVGNLPPQIRRIVFDARKKKAPRNIQSKMDEFAAKTPGFFSDAFWTP